MKKAVIYGLGEAYEEQKYFLQNEFEIVGYCDKNAINMEGYICPDNIFLLDFDYIYITSEKYFEEIKSDILRMGGVEEKIIGRHHVWWGDFGNLSIRDEWVKQQLLGIPQGKILLDAGAGQMKYKKYCKHLKYIAQDFGEYIPGEISVGLHHERWDTNSVNVKCDIVNMPFENESIDVILCTEVFEHLKDPILALKEFARIIKRGGGLILTAPFCSLTHFAPYYFCNGFSSYWYQENLKDWGFDIVEMTPYGNFYMWMLQELNRISWIAQRYSNCDLHEEEERKIVEAMQVIKCLADKDTCSNELLCHGYLVRAKKQ